MNRILKWTGIALGGLISLALLASLALYSLGMRRLTRLFPDIPGETVRIPNDPDAVTRGRHISIVWGCTRCHGEDMSGTLITKDPISGSIPILATIPASNLTSGEGGIARSYAEADWIRAIRHGVKPNGRSEVFMYASYSAMSDRDLGDLIAYLKQIPPIDSDYPPARFGPILPLASAVGLFAPAAGRIDHAAPRPEDPAPAATVEFGRYLSAICVECHGMSVAGRVKNWRREDLVRALRTGVLPNGQRLGPAMSSKTFGELDDMELAALWLYLAGAKR